MFDEVPRVVVLPAIDVPQIKVIDGDVPFGVREQLPENPEAFFTFRPPFVVSVLVLLTERIDVSVTPPNRLHRARNVCFLHEVLIPDSPDFVAGLVRPVLHPFQWNCLPTRMRIHVYCPVPVERQHVHHATSTSRSASASSSPVTAEELDDIEDQYKDAQAAEGDEAEELREEIEELTEFKSGSQFHTRAGGEP